MPSEHLIRATVHAAQDVELSIIDAGVKMDDAWSPYVQAELTIWTPPEAELDLIDPRDNLRATVALEHITRRWDEWAPQVNLEGHVGSNLVDHPRVDSLDDWQARYADDLTTPMAALTLEPGFAGSDTCVRATVTETVGGVTGFAVSSISELYLPNPWADPSLYATFQLRVHQATRVEVWAATQPGFHTYGDGVILLEGDYLPGDYEVTIEKPWPYPGDGSSINSIHLALPDATVGDIIETTKWRVSLSDGPTPVRGYFDEFTPNDPEAGFSYVYTSNGENRGGTTDVFRNVPTERTESYVRTLDLLLRERTVNHEDGVTKIVLESDEAQLQDYAPVRSSLDSHPAQIAAPATGLATSLSTLIFSYVLPASLPGNLTRFPVVNSHWVNTGATSKSYYNSGGRHYVICSRTSTAAWALRVGQGQYDTVTPGKTYTYQIELHTDTVETINLRVTDDSENVLVYGPSTRTTVGAWTKYSITFTAPASGKVFPLVWWATGAVGSKLRASRLTLTEGNVGMDFPELTYTADGDYSFVSDPEALVWEPGVDAWEYLEPLLQTAGMRLFCDEARAWHLVSTEYRLPGEVRAQQAVNVTSAEDSISRYADWFDAVVIEYRWTDAAGEARVMWDSAGAPGTKALRLRYDRPYPGPGAASVLLFRSQGRGRVLDISTLSMYQATPGQAFRSELPSSPVQSGYLSSTDWSWPDGTMRIGTRQLTETPADSWLALSATESWLDSPTGESWLDETT